METKLNWTAGLGALAGAGIGASLMYYLDPSRGARRRSMARDQVVHFRNQASDLLDKAGRDIAHRSQGFWARTRHALRAEEEVDDDILVERIRSKLGRYVSHPHSIEVGAQNGRVILKGLILSHELDRLLSTILKVDGVRSVHNRLEPHRQEENIPSLQGGSVKKGERPDFLQSNWAPGTRLLMSVLGSGGVVYGFLARRDGLGAGLAFLGLGILFRAFSNIETKELINEGTKKVALRLRAN